MNLTISEVSKKLDITKDTLRYYDKIGLVVAKRNENKYRYYTSENILELQYIEVMKYVGFNLKEIKQIITNMRNCNNEDLLDTQQLITYQIENIKKTINIYQDILNMMNKADDLLKKKESPIYSNQIQIAVQQVFKDLKNK